MFELFFGWILGLATADLVAFIKAQIEAYLDAKLARAELDLLLERTSRVDPRQTRANPEESTKS